jgi:L-threonylcarbamoyladenylate synthase
MSEPVKATEEAIREAAAIIRAGGLVAFPTETVYGLGADALNPDAVRRIFDAKGRPPTNPVIVHVGSIEALGLVAEAPERARRVAEGFWPGPLTLVLQSRPAVPDIVTAGGDTVGVRMPRHPVALALIREAGTPIAAPSANLSERLSPTTARHVADQLGNRVDMILDGGPTEVGLESTVVDLTVTPARVLRPGMVSAARIQAVLGDAVVEAEDGVPARGRERLRSPGQMPRHYAPRTPLRIVDDPWAEAAGMAILGWSPAGRPGEATILLPADAAGYAAGLYAALHRLDALGRAEIVVESPPIDASWSAVWDRLRRAERPHGGSH